MNRSRITTGLLMGGMVLLLSGAVTVLAQTPDERIAAVKQSIAASREALKAYEWTETTVVSYEGEEKSHAQATCSYGPDGKMVKEPLGHPTEAKLPGGLRGRRAKKKMAEIKAYMESAGALVRTYVPPDPTKIQACKDAGNISVELVEAGKMAVLRLKDYNLAGDSVGIAVDLTTNEMTSYEVAGYLDSPEDPVNLYVTMKKLEGGIIFPALIELDAPAVSINVDISNTDYRHVGE